jgi:hypothetical protein
MHAAPALPPPRSVKSLPMALGADVRRLFLAMTCNTFQTCSAVYEGVCYLDRYRRLFLLRLSLRASAIQDDPDHEYMVVRNKLSQRPSDEQLQLTPFLAPKHAAPPPIANHLR